MKGQRMAHEKSHELKDEDVHEWRVIIHSFWGMKIFHVIQRKIHLEKMPQEEDEDGGGDGDGGDDDDDEDEEEAGIT